MQQKQKLVAFMTMLAKLGVIYGKEVSEQLIDIYWQTLKCFKLSNIKQAIAAHVKNPDTGQYFPKPADLVRLIKGSLTTQALQAWTKVHRAILQFGAYQTIAFDDCLIHAIVEDMGGWVKLCLTPLKDLSFKAHEFEQRYLSLINKKINNYPKYCYGIVDVNNASNGYSSQRSVLLVGDLDQAKKVIANANRLHLTINEELICVK